MGEAGQRTDFRIFHYDTKLGSVFRVSLQSRPPIVKRLDLTSACRVAVVKERPRRPGVTLRNEASYHKADRQRDRR